MRLAITILSGLVHVGSILIFPGVAVWAIRRGPARLHLVTGIAVGLVALFALVASSAWFGNVRSPIDGYGETAGLALLIFGLTVAVPVVTAAFAIRFVQG